MTGFTNEQKLAALTRELKWRKIVYPNRILTGRITPEKAKYEIEIMQDIINDYVPLAQKERLL